VTTFDSELRPHNERLRAAAAVRRGDRVLDIGCGAGQTTREAARAAAPGTVLGVDVSAPMLERARELTAAEGLDNVTYEHGDAQTHPFAPASVDLAISRFGTMFFADPVAAFANIGRALRPGARLVLLVWQAAERNEWEVAIDAALGVTPTPAFHPFSLGDPDATTRILDRAGFGEIGFAWVREPVFYGRDVEEALAWVRGFSTTRDALAALDPDGAARALERLRAMLAEHRGDDGVLFDSRSWLITARRNG
jgi:SAM-dependent methyltransferase